MKSVRIAIYLSIAIGFLRKTLRKISPGIPRKNHGNIPRTFQGHPVQVGVAITHEGAPTYDYYRVATCIDCYTAVALVDTLTGMNPGYMYPFSIINPLKEINKYELEVLKSDKIHLLRENYKYCPNPCLLAKIMQEAAIAVIMKASS